MGLNVLLISLDSALAIDKADIAGNAKTRHIEYAKYLENLYIVVKTSRSIKPKVKKLRNNLFVYPTTSLNKYFFFCDAYNLASKICRENKINLIITQDPFITGLVGWLIKKKYDIPLNIQIHADMIDNKYFIKENTFNLFFNWLAKRLIRKADTIRVGTSKEKEKLAKLGIPDKKIWHTPVFINFDLFLQNNGEKIKRLYLNERFNRLVLFAGRLVKQKNLETLIQAIPDVIKRYPEVLFLIIGTGPEERRIKDLALNLGVKDNVCFVGSVSYDKIPDFFSACDLSVVTSTYEGTCMAILEAAASGKPVISTSHAGAYDAIIDGQTGYLVDFEDSKRIAKKVLSLLKNPKLAQKLGAKGRDFVLGRFDKEKILQDYFRMCEETARKTL